mmetsp:Transcript_10095/g.14276  ORF Transcript_10095/g.14276 Transcript_10095/m.14276 type:complete len:433 (-) Transcript_10095:154-1452(-)|eukprot:CAMPEP_0184868730 /NCGR_PEP_ID=MMETSP0580-20130426/31558_1 /TAXON_ID=1118495 /ORGANISM="Dactyliosolen fragilissimus" /LENGTH=432 /DNA_ID=CAMNT_0027369813 /DNA_START=112 /DNA_END=1410 /DNA_ORIENTATION=+
MKHQTSLRLPASHEQILRAANSTTIKGYTLNMQGYRNVRDYSSEKEERNDTECICFPRHDISVPHERGTIDIAISNENFTISPVDSYPYNIENVFSIECDLSQCDTFEDDHQSTIIEDATTRDISTLDLGSLLFELDSKSSIKNKPNESFEFGVKNSNVCSTNENCREEVSCLDVDDDVSTLSSLSSGAHSLDKILYSGENIAGAASLEKVDKVKCSPTKEYNKDAIEDMLNYLCPDKSTSKSYSPNFQNAFKLLKPYSKNNDAKSQPTKMRLKSQNTESNVGNSEMLSFKADWTKCVKYNNGQNNNLNSFECVLKNPYDNEKTTKKSNSIAFCNILKDKVSINKHTLSTSSCSETEAVSISTEGDQQTSLDDIFITIDKNNVSTLKEDYERLSDKELFVQCLLSSDKRKKGYGTRMLKLPRLNGRKLSKKN